MIGTGIKGTEFVSNELEPGSNGNSLCATFEINHLKAACDGISGKAVMTTQIPSCHVLELYLRSQSLDMQSASYWLHI
jgi:hypothetical protein